MNVAVIIWHDAHADMSGEWKSLDTPDPDTDPYEVVSVGIVLDRKAGGKPGHVSVAQSLTRDGYIDYVTHIPKAMVVERIDLYEIGVTDGQVHLDESRGARSGDVPAARRRKRSRRGTVTSPSHLETRNDR